MSSISPSKQAAIQAYRSLLKTQKQVFASKKQWSRGKIILDTNLVFFVQLT